MLVVVEGCIYIYIYWQRCQHVVEDVYSVYILAEVPARC